MDPPDSASVLPFRVGGGWVLQSGIGRRAATAVALLAIAASAPAVADRAADGRTPDRFDTVVIDAGHGGDDEGARGSRGLLEKQLVLEVARALGARLERDGLRVVLTRSDDTFIPLERRTSIANDARGDLFVSIHANATDDPKVRGTETFFLSLDASDAYARQLASRENASFRSPPPAKRVNDPLVAIIGDLIATEHHEESNEFARLAEAELEADAGRGRGVKQAPFAVLEGVQMPASLIEIGFITSPEDERELASASGRERVVDALVRATLAFGRRYDARRGVDAR